MVFFVEGEYDKNCIGVCEGIREVDRMRVCVCVCVCVDVGVFVHLRVPTYRRACTCAAAGPCMNISTIFHLSLSPLTLYLMTVH